MEKNSRLNNARSIMLLLPFLVISHTLHSDGLLIQAPPGCLQPIATFLICSNRTLKDLQPSVETVQLIYVNVTGEGLDAQNIRFLQWTKSNITDLNKAIVNPNYLLTLDVANNNITRLQNYYFQQYQNLKELNLSYNLIDNLPRYVFVNQSLEKLSISHNSLQALPFQVFAPMTYLTVLDISFNKIIILLDNFFRFNRYIEVLLLNNNNLDNLTSNALSGLTNLKHLDLSFNLIKSVSKGLFDGLNKLEYLNLAYNPFENLSSETFCGLINLKELNLSGNQLVQFTFGLLHFTPQLHTLLIDETQIEEFHNSDLLGVAKLKVLRIRNNKNLKRIEHYVLSDTLNLIELNISGNALTVLPTSLANLTLLRKLDISENPWACDCQTIWFGLWIEKMKKHNLTHTDLSCLNSYPNEMLNTLQHLSCSEPHLNFKTPPKQYRLKNDALLECRFSARPSPSITWITPSREVFHWNPDRLIPDGFEDNNDLLIPDRVTPSRIYVVDGILVIKNVTSEDSGRYTCYATNPIANVTETVFLHIDS